MSGTVLPLLLALAPIGALTLGSLLKYLRGRNRTYRCPHCGETVPLWRTYRVRYSRSLPRLRVCQDCYYPVQRGESSSEALRRRMRRAEQSRRLARPGTTR